MAIRPLVVFVSSMALAGCAGAPSSAGSLRPSGSPAAVASPGVIEGLYRRKKPAWGELTITREGDQFRIYAVGITAIQGPNAPTDCSLMAVGPMRDGGIVAGFVPYHDDNFTLEPADLKDQPRRITITLQGAEANVTAADVFGHCGLGSDLTGRYRRVRGPQRR